MFDIYYLLQDEGWGDEEENDNDDEVALSGQSLSSLIDAMSEDYINGKFIIIPLKIFIATKKTYTQELMNSFSKLHSHLTHKIYSFLLGQIVIIPCSKEKVSILF